MERSTSSARGRSLPALLRRLWDHLSRRRRRQLIILLGLMMLSAIAEVASLGAVLPFLMILMSPQRAFERPFVRDAASALGITSPSDLVLPLTFAFVAAAIVASSLILLVTVMSALIAIHPVAALQAAGGFGVAYGAITWIDRRRVGRNSERIAVEQTPVVAGFRPMIEAATARIARAELLADPHWKRDWARFLETV